MMYISKLKNVGKEISLELLNVEIWYFIIIEVFLEKLLVNKNRSTH